MKPREHEGTCKYCDAIEAFNTWLAEYDPDCSRTLLEQIGAYELDMAQGIIPSPIPREESPMKDCIAHHELEVFVGSDNVVRINVDGICELRVKVQPDNIHLICPPDSCLTFKGVNQHD